MNSFVKYYGSKELDASLLMMPLTGFLPASDPRIAGTIAGIEKHLTHDGFVARYTAQIAALVAGGVDLLAVETGNDILILKAALVAVDKYFAEHNVRLPVMISGTIFPGGRTLSAQSVEAFWGMNWAEWRATTSSRPRRL